MVMGDITEGVSAVKGDDFQAWKTNSKNYRPGMGLQELMDNYSVWAKEYNKSLCPGRYNGPSISAEELASYFPSHQRSSLKILDIAAGTGQVGLELHQRGFRHIDALDPCEGMLDVLRKTGAYEKTFNEFLGIGQSTVPDDTYDVVVISGGMGEGHIPVRGMGDMIRMAKSGGLIINVMRKEYLDHVEEYKGKLEPYLDELENQKKWKKICRKEVDDYAFGMTGLIYTYKVL